MDNLSFPKKTSPFLNGRYHNNLYEPPGSNSSKNVFDYKNKKSAPNVELSKGIADSYPHLNIKEQYSFGHIRNIRHTMVMSKISNPVDHSYADHAVDMRSEVGYQKWFNWIKHEELTLNEIETCFDDKCGFAEKTAHHHDNTTGPETISHPPVATQGRLLPLETDYLEVSCCF